MFLYEYTLVFTIVWNYAPKCFIHLLKNYTSQESKIYFSAYCLLDNPVRKFLSKSQM